MKALLENARRVKGRRAVGWLAASVIRLAPGLALARVPAVPPTAAKPDAATQARLVEGYGKMPMAFEVNQGQTDAQVSFLARGQGYGLFLTGDGAVLSLHGAAKPPADLRHPDPAHASLAASDPVRDLADAAADPPTPGAVVRMRLAGANPHAPATGLDPLPGITNTSSATMRRSGAPTHAAAGAVRQDQHPSSTRSVVGHRPRRVPMTVARATRAPASDVIPAGSL